MNKFSTEIQKSAPKFHLHGVCEVRQSTKVCETYLGLYLTMSPMLIWNDLLI